MTHHARITATERDAELAAHIRAADLEIARVMQRIAQIGNLVVARQRLAAALKLIEGDPAEETWTTKEILDSSG